MKYYHASPRKLHPGDRLTPALCKQSTLGLIGVYVSTSPNPHFTILDKARAENWHVYEVVPVGAKPILGNWDDLVCPDGCEVVKRVGSARGLAGKQGSRVFTKLYTGNRFPSRGIK